MTLEESILYDIDTVFNENPNSILLPSFMEDLYAYLYHYYSIFMDIPDNFESIVSRILVENGYIRSYETSYNTRVMTISKEHIEHLKNIPQPTQRTDEWYAFRYNHITASNGWKAYSTEAAKNALIVEKCETLNVNKYKNNLSETPMSWGHKYEPLTSSIYEEMNNTVISEFGCIPHKEYDFLAASPDGIVTGDINYGRMIEIKNVVSRDITGIPKKEYYTQVQLQLEVCDLNDCDFVETKFVEYASEEDYLMDGSFNMTSDNKKKGIIRIYIKDEQEYVYYYLPFSVNNMEEYKEWHIPEKEGEVWYKNSYWKLEKYSCVLIPRCKKWFQATLHELETIWSIIVKEREDGSYVKRKPKPRVTKCLIKSI
jgi:putative phage-type endonuclease